MRVGRMLLVPLIVVCILLHGVPVYAESDFTDLTWIILRAQMEFVDAANSTDMIAGARKALDREVGANAKLRGRADLRSRIYGVRTVSDLENVYNEVVSILGEDKDSHIFNVVMKAAVAALGDKHTSYMTESEARALMGALSGNELKSGGIGVFIEKDEGTGYTKIIEPIENTPAIRAGLQSRDLIVEVDGVSTKGLNIDVVSKRIQGEIGTSVRLLVRRGGKDFTVEVVREKIHVNSIRYEIVGDVAYIKVRYFGDDTNRELDEAFLAFETMNLKGCVLDLRNNGGGYVNAAVHMVSKFVSSGKVVVTFSGRAYKSSEFTSRSWSVKLSVVVLINGYSASASEIVAGALKDYGYTIVGEKSYGKGSMQKLFPLFSGAFLKMTLARFFTPKGAQIDGVGVFPHVEVVDDEKTKEDEQLERALQCFSEK